MENIKIKPFPKKHLSFLPGAIARAKFYTDVFVGAHLLAEESREIQEARAAIAEIKLRLDKQGYFCPEFETLKEVYASI